MEDLMLSKPGSSKEDSVKGRSKFYSELSFEDDFNPTSRKVSDNANKSLPPITLPNTRETFLSPFSPTHKEQDFTPNEDNTKLLAIGHASPLMCYVLRLKHGDELRKSLKEFAQKNALKAAFVLTCVGSAVSAKVRTANASPSVEANYMLDIVNPQEIVSLEGTISGGGHLHVALSDAMGKMSGGHLIELIVDTTAEVVIGDCSALSFARTFDQSTGFNELNIYMR